LLIDDRCDAHPNSHAKIFAVMPKSIQFSYIQTVNYFEGCQNARVQFAQAEEEWDLDNLYVDLAPVKGKNLACSKMAV
jgi:hypothetical protein